MLVVCSFITRILFFDIFKKIVFIGINFRKFVILSVGTKVEKYQNYDIARDSGTTLKLGGGRAS